MKPRPQRSKFDFAQGPGPKRTINYSHYLDQFETIRKQEIKQKEPITRSPLNGLQRKSKKDPTITLNSQNEKSKRKNEKSSKFLRKSQNKLTLSKSIIKKSFHQSHDFNSQLFRKILEETDFQSFFELGQLLLQLKSNLRGAKFSAFFSSYSKFI